VIGQFELTVEIRFTVAVSVSEEQVSLSSDTGVEKMRRSYPPFPLYAFGFVFGSGTSLPFKLLVANFT
jgi:hypothetical protein